MHRLITFIALGLSLTACGSTTPGPVGASPSGVIGGTPAPPSPAPSGRIAFIEAHRDGNGPLYTMAPDGSDARQLTSFDVEAPDWSPDGSMIAFDSAKAGGIHIFTIRADGTGLRQVTSGDGEGYPSWSPDGRHMVVDGPGGINIITVATGKMRPLTANPFGSHGYDSVPDYSPDGKQIVFHRTHDSTSSLFVVNVDGTGLHQLKRNARNAEDPRWSPDGSRILFTGDHYLYLVRPNGTGLRQLTSDLQADDSHASSSPNGRTILFTRYTFAPQSQLFTLDTISPDGGQFTLLYRSSVTDVNEAAWSGTAG
jgi:Tol biopolymer transport system component